MPLLARPTNTPPLSSRGPQRGPWRSICFLLLAFGTVAANDLALPRPGDHALRILSPTIVELSVVTQHAAPDQPLAGLVGENFTPHLPAPDAFVVTANEKPLAIKSVGFKRRVLYAPLHRPDVRLGHWLTLELAQPLPPDATVKVSLHQGRAGPLGPPQPTRGGDGAPPSTRDSKSAMEGDAPSSPRTSPADPAGPRAPARPAPLWPADWQLTARLDPHRESPAIHVTQVGYVPNFPKLALVGYNLGSLGELALPPSVREFILLDARTHRVVFRGPLQRRADKGGSVTPPHYQAVFAADFSAFNTPGEYRLAVDGLGVSAPFRIHDGGALAVARTYALGLYHQRCGAPNELPFTRHTHAACHVAPAEVPATAAQFPFTWKLIGELAAEQRPDASKPPHPFTASEHSQLYPFVRRGPLDVSGGHHDAGDYSKYTTNSAALVHTLVFAVDALPGLAALDNLGLPESGDGIPDLLQEAKWEADFLAKLQDDDGGFYFLVYPRDRRYESNVLPDAGEPQVVWPKNTAATAAVVAALAQCAASPHFKKHYPQDAARYLAQAKRGWEFLSRALGNRRNPAQTSTAALEGDAPSSPRADENGADGAAPSTPDASLNAYQRLTHYGDNFAHHDELAWAACELFLATGEPEFERELFRLMPDPTRASLRRWGWWRLSESWGNATRSYAFAARSGRLQKEQLDERFRKLCKGELLAAADDALARTNASAYATAFPLETKRTRNGGWYFSLDSAMDLAVGHVLEPRPDFLAALVGNLNFECGVNPQNIPLVTGLGRVRQRELVHQYAQNDRRALPPSGIPIGNIQAGLPYHVASQLPLRLLSFPDDGAAHDPYPLYDRWSDVHNVSTEFVVTNQARGLVSAAYLAAQTPAKDQPWRAAEARIALSMENPQPGESITARLEIADAEGRAGPLGPPQHTRGGDRASPSTRDLKSAMEGDAPSSPRRPHRARGGPSGPALPASAEPLDLSSADILWEARDHEPQRGAAFTFTPRRGGTQWIEAEAVWPDGRRVFAVKEFKSTAPQTAWVDDAFPDGVRPHAGAVRWITDSPPPHSGAKAHTTEATAATNASEIHEHGFDHASEPLEVGDDDVLFAHVWLDPQNPPREIMLAWNDGSWEHRAYWGANLLAYGADGSAGRRRMGELPQTGAWVRLEVPARDVGLAGRKVRGLSFSAVGGRAAWDLSGVRAR